MSAQAIPGGHVYYCLFCGPCISQLIEGGGGSFMTHHNAKLDQHPDYLTFEEEEKPQ